MKFCKHKKIIASVLVLSILAITVPRPARADAWGSNMMAAIQKEIMEELYLQIKETIIANLKIMAIRIIQGRLQTLITGVPGGMGANGLIISDWKQFINRPASKYSDKITNDFFSRLKSGAASGERQMIENAERKIKENIYTPPDLHNYVAEGKKENIFKPGAAQNPWLAWGVAGLAQNSETDIEMRARSLGGTAYGMEAKARESEGVAGQGVEGAKKGSSGITGGGQIVTPGSVIKDLITKVQSMPLDILVQSKSIYEIITSMVTQMLTQMIMQGIAKITNPIDKQIMNFRSTVGLPTGQIQDIIQGGRRTLP